MYSSLDRYFLYIDIHDILKDRHSDQYTVFLIYKLFMYRKFLGDGTKYFTYDQLRGYYGKHRFRITPDGIPIPKWQSIDRAIRRLANSMYPPLLEKVGRGKFVPTREFWIYVRERIQENSGSYWGWKQNGNKGNNYI